MQGSGIRCAVGRGDNITQRHRYWPRGSWSEKPSEKKWTPAIMVPQVATVFQSERPVVEPSP